MTANTNTDKMSKTLTGTQTKRTLSKLNARDANYFESRQNIFSFKSQSLRSKHCFLVYSRAYSVLSLQCEKEGEKMREGGRTGYLKIAPSGLTVGIRYYALLRVPLTWVAVWQVLKRRNTRESTRMKP